ncbi:hypothetical protein, unlikely [Trypanosoma brucei gambiense DAL972]|uniref:Uncharacterized protein n=1 Tax=Trypanosoma brucei gambiense (strain MHOM/CI/86/DAL972) TaxID=679716 RepID=C9ZYK4_TRYB9|nr:hypothetical protein, unlikely [Trypanosoma brucei gambiense DAL972]XP_011776788.1 hypothetical protein, unlikely [Trypanosoma brucei gambiense DAL972]CBH14503.1 hypothetical protein, unlikely [Trypanosoma brucei gambiense DAL972]CBH14522.1 hypothetical protein, unlikely [Trypanosoma brucei gambiense DAL972]|eukprot:XP_011776769.1 hypothetical protein, unlikely [Trypanosoma brucei gambiense DAL972]
MSPNATTYFTIAGWCDIVWCASFNHFKEEIISTTREGGTAGGEVSRKRRTLHEVFVFHSFFPMTCRRWQVTWFGRTELIWTGLPLRIVPNTLSVSGRVG